MWRDGAGEAAADAVPVLYGGSVKPDNAAELLSQPGVDGVLVGGASLDAVVAVVRVLEDDGFIRREENPRNRKSSLLVLTEKGEEIYRRVHMDRRAFFNMLTADFSETDLAQGTFE